MDEKTQAVIGAETIFQIGKVRTWRTVLKRKQVWKTARYTKGDIEALIVGIEDKEGNIGYGYAPSMFLEGESAPRPRRSCMSSCGRSFWAGSIRGSRW